MGLIYKVTLEGFEWLNHWLHAGLISLPGVVTLGALLTFGGLYGQGNQTTLPTSEKGQNATTTTEKTQNSNEPSNGMITINNYGDSYNLEDKPKNIEKNAKDKGVDWATGTQAGTTKRRELYAYGRIEYRDIYGVPRFTNFCYVMLPRGGDGALAPCIANKGNETDIQEQKNPED